MEQQLLQDMIRERDARILKIQRQLERQDQSCVRLQHAVADVRVQLAEESLLNRKVILELQKSLGVRKDQFSKQEKILKSQGGGGLHVYAEMMKQANQENVTSSYVVRAQSQLCRAMHAMGSLEHQVVLVESACGKVIKSLKDTVSQVVDDKTKVELEVMNELVAMDDKKREMEQGLKQRDDEVREQYLARKKEVGINNDSGSEDEEGSADEEEEELKEMIEEGEKEILRLEDETMKQTETIRVLRNKIKEATKTKDLGNDADRRPHLDKEEKVDVGSGQ